MNHFKKFLSLLLVLAIMLSTFSACGKKDAPVATEAAPVETAAATEAVAETEEPAQQTVSEGYYHVGDKIDDFTVTTFDGKEVSLYKVLEEKDMVLLNLWATWCGPCGSEFPAMQEAYEQYQDKVAIIALSTEPTDSDEVLAEYVREKGMTFYVGKDTVDMGLRMNTVYIPASIVVDRFGTICLIEEGAVPDATVFANLFSIYTAEDYTQSIYMPSMHAEKPNVQPSDPAVLNEALNGEGGNLVFTNASNPFYWPMTVEQKDGRTVAVASNSQSPYSKAVVETQVDVKTGDVLVMEYKLETNAYFNVLNVEVDGKSIKKSITNQDWVTYAYQFEEAGSHQVSVSLNIRWVDDSSYSNLWIDSIRVVSGDEASKALENNPKYPVAEKTQIQLLNENAKTVFVYNEAAPDDKEIVYFCDDPELQLLITLDETADPENTYMEDGVMAIHPIVSNVTEDGFTVEIPSTYEEGMAGFATLYCDGITYGTVIFFHSEESAEQYLDLLRTYNGTSFKWEYAEGPLGTRSVSGDVTYTVTYVDQNGDPVPGVVCQVCDESMCQVFTSDVNGVCQFTLPAKAYEIHTLKIPAGYAGDTTTITQAPANGGELSFTLTKN